MNPIVNSGLRVGPHHVVGQGFSIYRVTNKMVAVAATKEKVWKVEHDIASLNFPNTYKFVLDTKFSVAKLFVDGFEVASTGAVNRSSGELRTGMVTSYPTNQYIAVNHFGESSAAIGVNHLKIWKHSNENNTQGTSSYA